MALSAFERALVAATQAGLPLVKQPFEALGAVLGASEAELIEQLTQMKAQGLIRRIGAVPNHYAMEGDPPYNFTVSSYDLSSQGYIPLGRTDLEFDIPSHEQIVARHTVLLREKIKEVYKEAERQATDLRDQLSKLEALTYTAPAGEAAP